MQEEVLQKNPTLKINVYAVWFSMMKTDSPAAFPSAKEIMPDRRVMHFWDGQKDVGRWFKEKISPEYDGPVQWDAFYLYDSGATWKDTPQPLVVTNRTILGKHDDLARGISRLH